MVLGMLVQFRANGSRPTFNALWPNYLFFQSA